ncbi:MAG: hypothetical protein AABZ13_08630 [Planctomycetota bacterium]
MLIKTSSAGILPAEMGQQKTFGMILVLRLTNSKKQQARRLRYYARSAGVQPAETGQQK